MNISDVTQATHFIYKPRDTKYRIIDHNLKLKTSEGWLLGCSYIGKDQQLYVRPYEMFKPEKCVFLVED